MCGVSATPDRRVGPGSLLRAGPDGPVVARTLRAMGVNGVVGGPAEVSAFTPWGQAVLTASIDDVYVSEF